MTTLGNKKWENKPRKVKVHFDTVREMMLTREEIAKLIVSPEAMNICHRSRIPLELIGDENLIDYMFKTTTRELKGSPFSSSFTPTQLLASILLEKEDKMFVVHQIIVDDVASIYPRKIGKRIVVYHPITCLLSLLDERGATCKEFRDILDRCVIPYLPYLKIKRDDFNALENYFATIDPLLLRSDLLAFPKKESSFPHHFYLVEVKAQKSIGGFYRGHTPKSYF